MAPAMPGGRRRCAGLEGLARVGRAAPAGPTRPSRPCGTSARATSTRRSGWRSGPGFTVSGATRTRSPRRWSDGSGSSPTATRALERLAELAHRAGPARSRRRAPAPEGRGRARLEALPARLWQRRAAPHGGRAVRAGPPGRGRRPPARGPRPVRLGPQGRSRRPPGPGGPGPARSGRRRADRRPLRGRRALARARAGDPPGSRGPGRGAPSTASPSPTMPRPSACGSPTTTPRRPSANCPSPSAAASRCWTTTATAGSTSTASRGAPSPDPRPGPPLLGSGDRLFRNRGDGTFEDVTEASGIAGLPAGPRARRGGGRRRRRRPPRPLPHPLAVVCPVPEPGRRHLRGRHRGGRPGRPTGLADLGGVRRPGRRRRPRPLRLPLRGLGPREPPHLPRWPETAAYLNCNPLDVRGPARSPLPQRRRAVRRRDGRGRDRRPRRPRPRRRRRRPRRRRPDRPVRRQRLLRPTSCSATSAGCASRRSGTPPAWPATPRGSIRPAWGSPRATSTATAASTWSSPTSTASRRPSTATSAAASSPTRPPRSAWPSPAGACWASGSRFLDANDDGRLDLASANGHVNDLRPNYPYRMPAQLLLGGADGRLTDVTDRAGDALAGPADGPRPGRGRPRQRRPRRTC